MAKFIDITIKRNGDIVGENGDSLWLTISDTGKRLLYLSWDKGRIFFFLYKLTAQTTIKEFHFDSAIGIISFIYEGDWQESETGKIIQVHDEWEIQLNKKKDIKKVNKLV